MIWCRNCAKNVPSNLTDGKICCPKCGRVSHEDNFSQKHKRAKRAAKQADKQRNATVMNENEIHLCAKSHSMGATSPEKEKIDADNATYEEPEGFPDIDDVELGMYLLTEKEKQLKKIIWEKMNKEYLEKQAAKKACALARKKANEMNYNLQKRKQKRAADLKDSSPAQTAKEVAKQKVDEKRRSSKIRYDVLEKLLEDEEMP